MKPKTGHTEDLIKKGEVAVYRIPTEEEESDGTLVWNHTDLVLVGLNTGQIEGIGYTYADTATAKLIKDTLLPIILGEDPMDNIRLWYKMAHAIRNLGRPGIASMAIAAVDNALWDIKSKILGLPLCKLLGQLREAIPVYASGGFTSYSPEALHERFTDQKAQGFSMFKMKIGRDKKQDLKRMAAARNAIGAAKLFVDANAAYFEGEAVSMARNFKDFDITWYEEPVNSDDLDGLHAVKLQTAANIRVTAGEYGYHLDYFLNMLKSQAVDVLQADATRCGGITGLLKVGTLCEAFHVPLSTHCAPALHLHPALVLKNLIHLEYFYDHARIEKQLFDGAVAAKNGTMAPDLSRAGLGLEFKYIDAEKYKISI